MDFLERKDFISHSGLPLTFKIECDALTDEEIETFAKIISERFIFREVHGVPRGGIRIAKALEKYVTEKSDNILLVDDVLTTGGSMNEYLEKLAHQDIPPETRVVGVVLFSRTRSVPRWIYPVFQLW